MNYITLLHNIGRVDPCWIFENWLIFESWLFIISAATTRVQTQLGLDPCGGGAYDEYIYTHIILVSI